MTYRKTLLQAVQPWTLSPVALRAYRTIDPFGDSCGSWAGQAISRRGVGQTLSSRILLRGPPDGL